MYLLEQFHYDRFRLTKLHNFLDRQVYQNRQDKLHYSQHSPQMSQCVNIQKGK